MATVDEALIEAEPLLQGSSEVNPTIQAKNDAKEGALERTHRRRDDVDGLRALSVALVVVFHMKPAWCPAGFVGVDIFFVISGFVVATSLLRRESGSVSDFFLSFWARRCQRLLPALVLVVVSSAAVLGAVIPGRLTHDALTELRVASAGMLGSANTWLYLTADSYLDPEKEGNNQGNAFLHLWSLGVEEQFYLIFPFLFLVALGNKAVTGAICSSSSACAWATFGLTSAASLGLCWWLSGWSNNAAFYFLPSRFWELASGAALALLVHKQYFAELSTSLALLLQVMFLLLACLSLALLRVQHAVLGFPFPGAVLPVSAALAIIAAGCGPTLLGLNSLLALPLVSYVGRLTYPIYLWHMPLLAMRHWILVLYPVPQATSNMLLACVPVVTVVLAAATYHLVETPVQKMKVSSSTVLLAGALAITAAFSVLQLVMWIRASELHPRADEVLLALGWLAVLAITASYAHGCMRVHSVGFQSLCLVLSCAALAAGGWGLRELLQPHPLASSRYVVGMNATLNASETLCVATLCSCRRVPAKFVPPCSFDKGVCPDLDLPQCYSSHINGGESWDANTDAAWGCHVKDYTWKWDFHLNKTAACLGWGSPRRERMFYWLGDSKALMLTPLFAKIIAADRFRHFTWDADTEPIGSKYVLDALKLVLQPGDVVGISKIFCQFATQDRCKPHVDADLFEGQGGWFHDPSTTFDQWYLNFHEALDELVTRRNATLLLVPGNPLIPRCGTLPRETAACREQECREIWAESSAKSNSTPLVLAYGDLLCHKDTCDFTLPGTDLPALADAWSHVTWTALEYLTPFFCSRLTALGLGPFLRTDLKVLHEGFP